MHPLDPDISYRALQSRDARFDGRLFVGVISTGIYCRPICPARTPKRDNCRFFSCSAAAQAAGFRACLRCRPEIAPELPGWRGTSNTVSRALTLIANEHHRTSHHARETSTANVVLGAAWLRRGKDGQIAALSSVCPHKGCAIGFAEGAQRFECPCHSATFDLDGNRLSGPAERGLDPLPVIIERGRVKVTWVRYQNGGADRKPA